MKKFLKLILLLSLVFVLNESVMSQAVTWERIFDPISSFFRAVQTTDGGYIATGEKRYNLNYKFYTIKLNNVGDTSWSSLFDIQNTSGYTSFWVEQTNDKGFIITGQGGPSFFNKAYLLKINSSGNQEWWKSFEGNASYRGVFVKQLQDLGYGLLVYDFTNNKYSFIKTDSLGNLQWEKFFNSGGEDQPIGFIPMDSSGYLIISSSFQNPFYFLHLVRINKAGDTLWTRKVNYTTRWVTFTTIAKTEFNDIILGGSNAYPFDSSHVVKVDTLGDIYWKKTYGNNFGKEYCASIADVPGKGIIMAGRAGVKFPSEKGIVRLVDNKGNIIFEKFYVNPGSEANVFRSISLCSDNGFIVSGYTTKTNESSGAYILKTDSLGNLVDIKNNFEVINDYVLYQNYPNPFNSITTINYYLPVTDDIKLSIYNILGKEIAVLVNKKQYSGNHKVEWDASNFNSGVYFYRMAIGEFISTKKLVLLK